MISAIIYRLIIHRAQKTELIISYSVMWICQKRLTPRIKKPKNKGFSGFGLSTALRGRWDRLKKAVFKGFLAKKGKAFN